MTYTLTGTYALGDLTGNTGRLRFTPSTTIVDAGATIILPAPVEVDLAADGSFSVDLVGTDDVAYSPSGWVWTVSELLPGGRPAWSFELTADSDLSDLATVPAPSDPSLYVPITRTLTAGAGLTGGGTLAANRSFAVGAGTGITVNADDVAVDTAVIATQADLTAHNAATTSVHGIADTAALALTGDAPTAHAASHAAAGSDSVTVAESQVTGLTAALAAKVPRSEAVFRRLSAVAYAAPRILSLSTYAAALNSMHLQPMPLTAGTLDRIGIEVTGAGGVGSVIRLGLYADNGEGFAGALILDAGTVDSTGTGVKEITVSQAVSAGLYWLAYVAQVGTAPTVRSGLGVDGGTHNETTAANIGLYNYPRVVTTHGGIAGALPTPAPAAGAVEFRAPRVFVRYA